MHHVWMNDDLKPKLLYWACPCIDRCWETLSLEFTENEIVVLGMCMYISTDALKNLEFKV